MIRNSGVALRLPPVLYRSRNLSSCVYGRCAGVANQGRRSGVGGPSSRPASLDRGRAVSVLTDRGGSVAAVASGQRVPGSIADCDRALVLLRVMVRSGTVDERRVARIACDDVLDRRNEIAQGLRV